ncbi:MAG TPA: aspartate carbamoyltransferase, partial [Planctomycetes bacterium]|nr:aspartate carbamoyltransferase [Planctomycetota bacterium]
HAHPTQALLDMLTMRDRFGGIEGLKVAVIGDVLHSRVARSLFHGLVKTGASVTATGPSTVMPRNLPEGIKRTETVDEALQWADVLYFLRIQLERQSGVLLPSLREYSESYGLTAKRLASLREGQVVMHPGPVNRGVELAAASADCEASLILPQVTSGVYVRMAVLYLTLSAAAGREVPIG